MGFFSLGMFGLAFLAAVQTRGRRFPAYAAVMALGLAAASVFYPTAGGRGSWSVGLLFFPPLEGERPVQFVGSDHEWRAPDDPLAVLVVDG